MKLTIREQTCHLMAERAVYWEEQQTLILADIHLGKATVFRKAGIPIPEGTMEEDLFNIAEVIDEVGAKRCIIVGDLIHAKSGLSESVRRVFGEWLKSLNCEIDLVLGNHDKALIKSLPEEWHLRCYTDHLLIEPFYFAHIPRIELPWFVWSGHVHPQVVIGSRQDSLMLRCFCLYEHLGVLPAFSAFVGGTIVKQEKNCQIYGIAGSKVILTR